MTKRGRRRFWTAMLALCWGLFVFNAVGLAAHLAAMPARPLAESLLATWSAAMMAVNAYTAQVFWRLLGGAVGRDCF